MATFPQPHPAVRAPRYAVSEEISVTIQCDQHHPISGRLAVVSVTGGRAVLRTALAAGSFVELRLTTRFGPISALAEMMPPRPAGANWQQAFRFVAIPEDDAGALRRALQSLA